MVAILLYTYFPLLFSIALEQVENVETGYLGNLDSV